MSVMLIPLSTREPDDPGYVTLKVYVNDLFRGNEIAIYERIKAAAAKQNHLGHETIRKCLSSFEIQGKKHTCIVHEALGMTMEHILLNYVPDRAFRIEEIKMFILEVLIGLDFLHTEARIIHTGKLFLQPYREKIVVLTYVLLKIFSSRTFLSQWETLISLRNL